MWGSEGSGQGIGQGTGGELVCTQVKGWCQGAWVQQSRRVGWVMNCTESVAALVCIATWTASRPPSFTSPSSHAGPPPNLPSPTAQEAALLRHEDSMSPYKQLPSLLSLSCLPFPLPHSSHSARSCAPSPPGQRPRSCSSRASFLWCGRATCRSCSSCLCCRYEHVWAGFH